MSRKNGFLPVFFVMTFYVNGIKQENNNEYAVEMLIDVESMSLARILLEEKNILILSLSKYTDRENTLGDVSLYIVYNNQEIRINTTYTQAQEAANFFVYIGFDLQKIQSTTANISDEESQDIIKKANAYAQNIHTKQSNTQQREEVEQKKIYSDDHLEQAKYIVLEVFEIIDRTLKRSWEYIALQDMKKIIHVTEELKKLRMGTNFEKIRDTIQEVFALLKKVDDEYFVRIQDPNATIVSGSVVTMTDIDREIEKMQNIQILKKLGAHISVKNQDYAVFGKLAIYRKFLQKDILLKIGNIGSIVFGWYDIAEFVLVVVLMLLGVYTVSNELYMFSLYQYELAYMLVYVGMRWMLVFVSRYMRTKQLPRLFLIVAVAVIVHYVLMWAIKTNFAL